MIGLDVGSTTVKAVVMEPASQAVLWRDYQRHETRQFGKCLEFLDRIEAAFPNAPREAFRVFATGSGGAAVGGLIGAHFCQEVNAVSLAVERRCPDVWSVIELGGQDAKIIVFRIDPKTGRRKKFPTMNDKCAGGTGAVIDKIAAKLQIPVGELARTRFAGLKVHPVAGKCGVFAETDINGLQKQGVPVDQLMASLFESLVLQNLSVLTRGHTLWPKVLLLGGPNCFIRGLQECWRHHIPQMWAERGVEAPASTSLEELVFVPDEALYFGALGAVEIGRDEVEDNPGLGVYLGTERLRQFLETGRGGLCGGTGRRGLVRNEGELGAFMRQYASASWAPPAQIPGTTVEAFVGVDAGSTSTKGVLIDGNKEVIAKAYQLSKGNPIEDARDILAALRDQVERQSCRLDVLGVGVTGYAKDMLKDVIGADIALVETVAHTQSGRWHYPHADVICDVGGQDIKIIALKHGVVKDFRLNTQCSAGNGYYLQSTAEAFGYTVTQYADAAFRARSMPEFGYGCAVFMQSDIVDFQRQGWTPEEIMAGLAAVLPKNIWLYVCQIPNLARLGRTFVLQGGVQRNLAAVKAQVDFIQARFEGSGVVPEIIVHRHCGESGAIGCALEAHRLCLEERRRTAFIGFDAVRSLRYETVRDETTRCRFCRNRCLRTFIHVRTENAAAPRRLIVANCEKGTAANAEDVRHIEKRLAHLKTKNPDMAEIGAREAFEPVAVADVADKPPKPLWFTLPRTRRAMALRRGLMERRRTVRLGMPRVMNMYTVAPFFMGYFQSLGVPSQHIVWSDYSSQELYKEGARRGSIDPCYPSKLAIPHVHNLLHRKHPPDAPLTHIFFPLVDSLPTWLEGVQGSRTCPTSAATPEAAYAAFVKESDVFAERGIRFKKTFLNLDEPSLCGRQMYEDWAEELGLSARESHRAVLAGLMALSNYAAERRREGRRILDMIEREGRIGIVLLARPYHNDPGIHHGLTEAFQKLGYPVLTHDALPMDEDVLEALFGEEVARGEITHPRSIDDVWKNSFSENGSRKLWAAKFVARHPNLIGLELSNFKCGHDAAICSTIEEIVEASGTPFFYFREIDENKPYGAFRIRIETIAYFLERYRAHLAEEAGRLVATHQEPLQQGEDEGFAVA